MGDLITNFLTNYEVNPEYIVLWKNAILLVFVLIVSFLSNYITKKLLVAIIHKITKKTKTKWDDILAKRKVFTRLSHIVPAIFIYFFIDVNLMEWPIIQNIIMIGTKVYIVGAFLWSINSFFNGVNDIYDDYDISKQRLIKSYIQVVKMFFFIIGGIIIISIIINKSPFILLGGMGALMAIIMLIFKDSILGLVAGIQLAANDMLHLGDWISMPKHDADGDVIEMNLTTIKVKNWDKTITTIPSYSLISESFKNWRSMQESGGRRIKRYLKIDVGSIRFATDKDLEKYKKLPLLKDYIEEKEKEIKEGNNDLNPAVGEENRHLSNIGVFRKYIELYLRNSDKIRQDMTFIVRLLEPTETGLPLQIYVFTNTVKWVEYESIQSDIFDHVLSVIGYFDLNTFQYSTNLYS